MPKADLIVEVVSVIVYAGSVFRGARHDHDTLYRLPRFWADSVVQRGLGKISDPKQIERIAS